MTDSELIDTMLSLGLAERYDDVRKLPGAGNHSNVCRFSAEARKKLNHFFSTLDNSHRRALAKAVSVYEDSIGGLGSVTLLRGLIENTQDSDRSLLDWILKNTRSYSYYSGTAKSAEELERNNEQNELRRKATVEEELERERQAKKSKAEQSGHRLANAIRRIDVDAVTSLLTTIGDYAEVNGCGGIWATALRKQLDK